MKVQLSTGEVKLWVWYDPPGTEGRRTYVSLSRRPGGIPNPPFGAGARCSPKDQFVRRTGRREALKHFLSAFPKSFPLKADRTALWRAVCPELRQSKKENL